MMRRAWGRACLAGLLLLVCGCGGSDRSGSDRSAGDDLAALGAKGRAAGYSLLLITLDTTRADHLGVYGYAQARTPAIDGLAQPGLRFTQTIAPAPLTLPSHSSIMTGKRVPDHGVRNNAMYRLKDDGNVTLAEVLRDAGYQTGAFVSAYVLNSRFGIDQGFGVYDDSFPHDPMLEEVGRFDERRAYQVTDAALAWFDGQVAAHRDKPFFAWVHYFDPHFPYFVADEFKEQFGDEPYDAEIAFVDEHLGRLLTRLKEDGLLEKTLIVLTADHGESLGEHGEPTHSRHLYDSTMRVPLILHCPELFPDSRVIKDREVSLCDIYPTVLDLLGVAHETHEGSRNFLTSPADPDRAIYIETLAPLQNDGTVSLHGLRRLADKYILAPTPEYYNLQTDPKELYNLAPTDPEAAVLAKRLHDLMTAWPTVKGAEEVKVSKEDAERLAALGYVGAATRPAGAEVVDPKALIQSLETCSRVLQLSSDGKYKEAVTEIEKWLRKNPRDANAWEAAATVHHRGGNLDQAIGALGQAALHYPTAPRWVKLAQYHLEAGHLELAEQAVDTAEQIDPKDPGVYLAKGQILCAYKRYENAIPQFERALALDPNAGDGLAKRLLEETRKRVGSATASP
jgi:choline-sulfatase